MPTEPSWSYPGQLPEKFYSKNVSNAQRLPNGNTLICEGANGRFFEVNTAGITVWSYINPVWSPNTGRQQNGLPTNQVFRAVFYDRQHTAFKGKDLRPGNPLEAEPVGVPCIMDNE
jgi:hypothetical protein